MNVEQRSLPLIKQDEHESPFLSATTVTVMFSPMIAVPLNILRLFIIWYRYMIDKNIDSYVDGETDAPERIGAFAIPAREFVSTKLTSSGFPA